MKKILAAALLATLVFATSCQTGRRFGKNALITLSSPYVILHGASTDAAIDAKNIQTGFETGYWMQFLAFPFTFAYRVLDHTWSTAIHVGDMAFTPFYALAELHPDTKIEPIGIYRGTPFGLWPDDDTDEDEGVAAGGSK